MMKYSVQIVGITGTVDFAEKYLTGGLAGTYTLYKLVGLLFCVLGLCYMLGLFSFIPTALPNPTTQQSYLNLRFLI
jgi:hypothetical protein